MTSPPRKSNSESPRTLRIDPATATIDPHRALVRSPSGNSLSHLTPGPRLSPTLTRGFDDVQARERQRTMDVDSAMQLHRARSGSVANDPSPREGIPDNMADDYLTSGGIGRHPSSPQAEDTPHFPMMMSLAEQDEMLMARGDYPHEPSDEDALCDPVGHDDDSRPRPHLTIDLVDQDAVRLGVDAGLVTGLGAGGVHDPMLATHDPTVSGSGIGIGGLPVYQPSTYHSHYDFAYMEHFAAEEKDRLGLTSPVGPGIGPLGSTSTGAELRRRLAQASSNAHAQSQQPSTSTTIAAPEYQAEPSLNGGSDPGLTTPPAGPSAFSKKRQRKLSQSNSAPRRQGKLALFEGQPAASAAPSSSLMPPTSHHITFGSDIYHSPPAATTTATSPATPHPPADRPYRFSFYSNSSPNTIHARSMSELPAEGQSFEELFVGPGTGSEQTRSSSRLSTTKGAATPETGGGSDAFGRLPPKGTRHAPGGLRPGRTDTDTEINTWWLDVTCPTDEEMRMLSKVFSIHPLTMEDILMEETREKIELFRNYYFVCFRSFDQDIYSPTHLEPLNMYIIVFREGTLSFHFRGTPHPQSVRRRIKQLKDYISVTSDWISYALIDDITDAFGPLIQSIEYEVDSIDELVLILKETEQSDMLRRIGTCRKKVMGLLRLMGNKADVVKGLAKRCNENWSMAPKSDIGLYLSDIQDHLITMTQNLNHYEKILSRSHSNYLAQISIEMTDANNQINDVLSKLTALGTVLIPMNLVTGLWGMNVHVPGQDIETGYTWFFSIIGALVGFAVLGGILTYKLLRSS